MPVEKKIGHFRWRYSSRMKPLKTRSWSCPMWFSDSLVYSGGRSVGRMCPTRARGTIFATSHLSLSSAICVSDETLNVACFFARSTFQLRESTRVTSKSAFGPDFDVADSAEVKIAEDLTFACCLLPSASYYDVDRTLF